MSAFRIAWRGVDLFDSVEEEGMTLGARACYRIACEIVSGLRGEIDSYVPEPWQDDAWASLEFVDQGQKIRCVISMQDENEYSVTVECVQGILSALMGRRAPHPKMENVDTVRMALRKNCRIEILEDATTQC